MDLKEPECEPLPSAKQTDIAAPSSKHIGQEFQSSETLDFLTAPSFRDSCPFTLSVADSLVRTQASGMLAAKERPASAQDSIPNQYALLASLDARSLWKTCQGFLFVDLETFCERWPKSGLMRNGSAYQRETLARITCESESGSWPTPAARDGKDLSTTTAYLAARARHSPCMATKLLENGVHWSQVSQHYEASMGYPLQWSVGVYMVSVIRSSRKSQK